MEFFSSLIPHMPYYFHFGHAHYYTILCSCVGLGAFVSLTDSQPFNQKRVQVCIHACECIRCEHIQDKPVAAAGYLAVPFSMVTQLSHLALHLCED